MVDFNKKGVTFREKISSLLSKFGVVHQVDTIVGLSGGERKRLTITEAIVLSVSITCWDSSDLKSDLIFDLLDNVLVLEKDRRIFIIKYLFDNVLVSIVITLS
ncbi:hypothetical protein ACTFIW_010697 [Dictyostelium discoideum]